VSSTLPQRKPLRPRFTRRAELRASGSTALTTAVNNLVEMTPRLIDELPSEEKLRIYEMLGLRVTSAVDGTLEITGDLAGLSFGKSEPTYPSPS
jgi:hypothetical protein